jgi:hypothetical protein
VHKAAVHGDGRAELDGAGIPEQVAAPNGHEMRLFGHLDVIEPVWVGRPQLLLSPLPLLSRHESEGIAL